MSEPEIYKVNSKGERVADDDVTQSFVVNEADPDTPRFLKQLQEEGGLSESAQRLKDGSVPAGVVEEGPVNPKSVPVVPAANSETFTPGPVVEPKPDPAPVKRKVQ